MIRKANERKSTDEVMSLLHPVISEWFRGKFREVTEAQGMAVPLIHARRSVLVSSPTGSGKTLTAFLSIINELALLAQEGRLEDRIYAVYISPLKALANDINENLMRPLGEISSLFEAEGLTSPRIKVAVRTGDTLPAERQRQLRAPPHIFITTPESLSLILSTPVFSKKFEAVDYVIVDEVHEVCDSKRGSGLSVALERLQASCRKPLVRIGLSATVAPLEQVGEFLVGNEGGNPRDLSIVEVFGQRDLDLSVICPARDMTSLSFEVVNSKMYDMLKEMIEGHRTTLVFTNTRSGTESVVYKLKERGLEQIGAHHGSLSRETRLEVESSLRAGQLRSVVSSTSLELGIDVGSIDLVVQIGSPKSVSKGLQRVGRAGHQYKGTSKGRIVVFESDDLVECAVLCRAAHRKMIDRVTIPDAPLDVLAQVIVGLSIERPWTVEEAMALLRRSYTYRNLAKGQLESVLRYLGGKEEFEGIYSKVWYDDQKGVFGRKHGSRMIFYLNQGTIPEEADYKVFSERGSLIGSLSEKFVERLSTGDIFVLGGRSYEFVRSKGTKAFVKNATGRKPTVPSWTGELLPRSFDLSVGIGRFRKEMDERLGRLTDGEVRSWLMDDFDVDEGSATTIVNYFKEQRMLAKIPTDERLVVEGYVDQSGNRNAIFHFPFGRRVNDALSRAYAQVLSQKVRSNVTVSVTDDNFMLTSSRPFDLESLPGAVDPRNVEGLLRSSVRGSELFSQRFRHVATRSFMVLRNYKGRELSVARQQLRSQRLLDALHELEDFPVMAETYAEILSEVMDLENARGVLESMESGTRRIEFIPFSGVPSPFAHNVVLVGVSDIVLMEDKSMLLRELHRKVLARVLGEGAIREFQFDQDVVAEYFSKKHPPVSSKHELLESIRLVGPMNLFREKGESAFSHASADFDRVRAWGVDLLREGKVRSIWVGEDVYVATEQWPTYACIHSKEPKMGPGDRSVLSAMGKGPISQPELVEATGLTRETVKEVVRRLETSNAIYRADLHGQSFRYAESPPIEQDRAACMSEAIVRHLSFHAPIGLSDLAYEVGVHEPEAEGPLNELLLSERVVSGRFVVGDEQQYMLAEDYLRLQSSDVPVFDRETVRRYSEAKHFERLGSVRSYFEKYGEAGMAYDIFQRVPSFDHAGFGALRSSSDLLLGRFVRGRLRYVLKADAPSYLGVYRRTGPDKYEAQILRAVASMGSGAYLDIAAKVGFPPETMRERFDSLDRKGYLLRLYDDAESWSSRSVYTANPIEPSSLDPYSPVLKRFVCGNGPVTALQAASYLDVDVEDARVLLEKIGTKRISVGLERTEMFILADELPRLQGFAAPQEARMRILSLYDPFLGDRWAEITSRYGEGWIFPVVLGGQMVGMVEKWLMAGSVEIRRVDLSDPSLLGRLIDALDWMMKYYNGLGVDIIRVREFMGADASSLAPEHLSEFTRRGYSLTNGMLVKGRVLGACYPEDEVLRTVLVTQNLSRETRMGDMSEMLGRYGGIRSDAEALARVERFESLSRLHRRGEVVRGHLVPDRVGYCTSDAASIYSAARQSKLTDAERYVLRVVRHQQPVKRDRLLELSPLGEGATAEAVRSLYLSSRLYLDGSQSYVSVPKSKLRRGQAWARIIERMFGVYGVMSAESLATLLGHEIPMREVRAALRSLEDDGFLKKGYLIEGSTTLYWASDAAVRILGKARFDRQFVLSPEDNLTLYLRAGFRGRLPDTGRHAVFRGPELIGSFVGKVREGKLEVDDIHGDEDCAAVIVEYARTMGLALREREAGRISDWEIMEFYKKTHLGG